MLRKTSKKMYRDPPAYYRSSPSEAEADAIEAWYEQNRPKDRVCRCEPPCKLYCTKLLNVFFGLQPTVLQSMSVKRLFRDRKAQPAWRAIMLIEARNVPRLMRDGFSWSPDNLNGWNQNVFLDRKRKLRWLGRGFSSRWGWAWHDTEWYHNRSYWIKALGPDPDWGGTMTIFGKKASTVTNFDISWVDIDTVVWAFARDWNGTVIYDTRKGPDGSFNTVLPGMPLRGWWPWPKTKEDHSDNQASDALEGEKD